MTTTRKDRGPKWSWRDGVVDQQGDHLELRYGPQDAEPETWVAAARVGLPRGRVFPVQWLLDRNASANRDTVDATVRDLAFILTEVGGSDPWLYAQYHAGTTSNWYGFVHWVNYVRPKPVTKSRSEAARKAWRTRRARALGAQVERDTPRVEKGETGESLKRAGRWTAIEEAMRTGRVVRVQALDGRSLDRGDSMKIWVEVHPWTNLGLPKRWRVMCNGEQRSVHETEAEAEAAAVALRQPAANGGTEPKVPASSHAKGATVKRQSSRAKTKDGQISALKATVTKLKTRNKELVSPKPKSRAKTRAGQVSALKATVTKLKARVKELEQELAVAAAASIAK